MFCHKICYLVFGAVLGAILGLFVCDDTKKRIVKAIHNKTKQFSSCVQSSSEKTKETINVTKGVV